MSDHEPIEATNIDGYGGAPVPWSRAAEQLAAAAPKPETPFFLTTVGAGGRPHAAGIGVVWHDGALYFTSGPAARKSRHLAENPAATISCRLPGIDLVFEGDAHRVSDRSSLETVAALFAAGGWPAEVAGDAITAPYSAQSAGPAPWYLYRFAPQTVYGVTTEEPFGAMRWRFAR